MNFWALFKRILTTRPFEVAIDEATEQRVRAHIDRYNAEMGRSDPEHEPLDPDDDDDIAIALGGLIDGGLTAAEEENGLAATPWGDLISLEQQNEEIRRRKGGR